LPPLQLGCDLNLAPEAFDVEAGGEVRREHLHDDLAPEYAAARSKRHDHRWPDSTTELSDPATDME